jgi:hypothetical protein
MFIEYLKYLESKESNDFESIINHCNNYIQHETSLINKRYRDDFKQTLLMKLFAVIGKGIITINEDFEPNKCRNSKYYSKFLNHIGKQQHKYLQDINLVESEYFLFVGEIKLRMYIKRVCFTTRIDFYRAVDKSFLSNCISLNSITNDGIELIDRMPMKEKTVNNELMKIDLTTLLHKTEYDFLMKYTEFNNQKEYADYMGVSQQYISKKINSIRKTIEKGRTRI